MAWSFLQTWRPFLLDGCCHPPHATHPDTCPGTGWKGCPSRGVPIRFCSRRGLPCRLRCRSRGGLLPHRFTLTGQKPGGLFSVALSLGSPPPAVSRRRLSVEPGLSSHAAFRLMTCAAARPAGAAVKPCQQAKGKDETSHRPNRPLGSRFSLMSQMERFSRTGAERTTVREHRKRRKTL